MSKKPSTEKKFVYCFMALGSHKPPFLAELLEPGKNLYLIKVGRDEYEVPRAACSTTPYTQAELDKHVPSGTYPVPAGSHPVRATAHHPALGPTVKKIQGFFA